MGEHGEYLIVEQRDGVTIVTFARGDVIDAMYLRDVEAELTRLASTVDPPSLVIDFVRVRFLTSSALGMLVGMRELLADRGGRICIANVVDELLDVFKLTGVPKIIDLYDTIDEAVASFA